MLHGREGGVGGYSQPVRNRQGDRERRKGPRFANACWVNRWRECV